jgi:NADPH:quinone reductase-like Zn-dependent oxidoreductase
MGCRVFGTSRTADKLERARDLGLAQGIDTSREDFADFIRAQTGGQGVAVVMDHLGGPAWDGNVASLSEGGRLVLVGLLAGARASVDLRALMSKRIHVVATTLRSRPLEEKIAATRRFAECVVPWLAGGVVRPVVDRVYPLGEIREAAARMESNEGFGRVVIRMD